MDKGKVAAFCRKALGALVSLMRVAGFTYPDIEEELKLRPGNEMTAWRLEGNKHKN
jgi:hypothetical protein